jgi:ribosomal protein S6
MKLSLTMYDTVYMVKTPKNDMTLDEMLEAFSGLLKNAGFSWEGDIIIENEEGVK